MQPVSIAPFQHILRKMWAYLRPRRVVLLTPQAVVWDAGGSQAPVLLPISGAQGRGVATLQLAIQTLLQWLQKNEVQGQRIDVYLSEAWLWPLHMPFAVASLRHEDVLVLLKTQYRKIYGELAEHWHTSWDVRHGQLWAAAMPLAPLQALKQGLATRGIVLHSVQPLAPVLAAQLLTQNATTWLVLQQAEVVTLLLLEHGVWQHWVVLPAINTGPNNNAMLLEREAARISQSCRNVTVLAVGAEQQAKALQQALQASGWKVQSVPITPHSKSALMRSIQSLSQTGAA